MHLTSLKKVKGENDLLGRGGGREREQEEAGIRTNKENTRETSRVCQFKRR